MANNAWYVYGDKVQVSETGERGKVIRVSERGKIGVEHVNGEWALYDADELEHADPAAPVTPPAERRSFGDGALGDNDWDLTAEQALWMLQHNNVIVDWQNAAEDDLAAWLALDELVQSAKFKTLFDDMGFDEAYDRYETILEKGARDEQIAALEARITALEARNATRTAALERIASESDLRMSAYLSEYDMLADYISKVGRMKQAAADALREDGEA